MYFIVKVVEPGVKPEKNIALPEFIENAWAVERSPSSEFVIADMVLAPDSCTVTNLLAVFVPYKPQEIRTNAQPFVPIVTVTAGPAVARSVKEVEFVDWSVNKYASFADETIVEKSIFWRLIALSARKSTPIMV